jgi:hypothetical protein
MFVSKLGGSTSTEVDHAPLNSAAHTRLLTK